MDTGAVTLVPLLVCKLLLIAISLQAQLSSHDEADGFA